MQLDEEIGQLCLRAYNKLGKSGKPSNNEYTVLAAIVCNLKTNSSDNNKTIRKVVALTTGTKCHPSNELAKNERIVDSHAEPLLKRAFKRYLISALSSGRDLDDMLCGVDLFVSQLPCGSTQRWKGVAGDEMCSLRKPGRGEACLRANCLSKITKWVFMGLQGKQLIRYTKRPVLIDNIFIGNCGPNGEYDKQMADNWFKLGDSCVAYKPFDFKCLPKIIFCQNFRNDLFIKTESKESTPTSIVMWSTGDGGQVSQVLTEGHKLGVTKKNIGKNPPLVCDSLINRDIEILLGNGRERDSDLCDVYEKQWTELKKCKLFEGMLSLDNKRRQLFDNISEIDLNPNKKQKLK